MFESQYYMQLFSFTKHKITKKNKASTTFQSAIRCARLEIYLKLRLNIIKIDFLQLYFNIL